MPAKSRTAIYFPVARAHLAVHFGFEMADEFTRNTFPFRFTIPPASLDPSVPRPEMDFSEKSDRQARNTVPRRLAVSKEDGRRNPTDC